MTDNVIVRSSHKLEMYFDKKDILFTQMWHLITVQAVSCETLYNAPIILLILIQSYGYALGSFWQQEHLYIESVAQEYWDPECLHNSNHWTTARNGKTLWLVIEKNNNRAVNECLSVYKNWVWTKFFYLYCSHQYMPHQTDVKGTNNMKQNS